MITFQDKVALNENPDIPEVNKITAENVNEIKTNVNSLNNIVLDTLRESTPEIKNATMTYTERTCRYRYVGQKVIVGTVVLRGNITAVGNPAWARIILNIPPVDSLICDGWGSFGSIEEASGAFSGGVPYSTNVGMEDGKIVIGFETSGSGGTVACSWQVANNVYIKAGFVINLQ